MEGVQLEQHYRDTLKALGEQGGMLGLTFRKAQNKIQDPAKLRKLVVDLIGNEQWLAMSADVKGDADVLPILSSGSVWSPAQRRDGRMKKERHWARAAPRGEAKESFASPLPLRKAGC